MARRDILTLAITTLVCGQGCHAVAPFSSRPVDGAIGSDGSIGDTVTTPEPDARPPSDTRADDADWVTCQENPRVRLSPVCSDQNWLCDPSDFDCDGLPNGLLDPDPLCNRVIFIEDFGDSLTPDWAPPDALSWDCGAIKPQSHRAVTSLTPWGTDTPGGLLIQVELTYEGLPTGDTGHLLSIDFHDGLGGARQRLCQVGRAGGFGKTLLQGGVEPHAVRLDYDLTAEPLLLQAWITGEQLICAIGAVDGSRSASVINGLPGLTTGLLGLYVENATVWIDAIRIYELGVDD